MNYAFFALDRHPFDQKPDIEHFFATETIRNVWLRLSDRILTDHSIVVLVGKAGVGKTMLSNFLLEEFYTHAPVTTVVVQQPTPFDLLTAICADLEIGNLTAPYNSRVLVQRLSDSINAHRARGAKIVILIDNAQDIRSETFRLLKKFLEIDKDKEKTLRLILVGQPDLLAHLEDEGLANHIDDLSAPCWLRPFSKKETRAYIEHRLVAGGGRQLIFNAAAGDAVYRLSGGIPRTINIICDNALQIGWRRSERVISASVVHAAAQDVLACQEDGWRSSPLFDSVMSKIEYFEDRFIQFVGAPFGRFSRKPSISEAACKVLEAPSGNSVLDSAPALPPSNDEVSNNAAFDAVKETPSTGERGLKEKTYERIQGPSSAEEKPGFERLTPIRGTEWGKEKASGLAAVIDVQKGIEQRYNPANAQFPIPNGTRTAISVYGKRNQNSSRAPAPPGMLYIPDMRLHSAYSGQMIEVAGFFLDRTSVTNKAYSQFVESTGYPPPDHWFGVRPLIRIIDYPVVGVSLDDARRFAEWRGRRLPTWCEWEASVRRPDNRRYPWGDDWKPGRCNDPASGLGKLMPVEAFPNGASIDGCFDLLGNAWEWTDLEEDMKPLEQGYAWVVGGSFRHSCVINGVVARSQVLKINKYAYLGFRCAANGL